MSESSTSSVDRELNTKVSSSNQEVTKRKMERASSSSLEIKKIPRSSSGSSASFSSVHKVKRDTNESIGSEARAQKESGSYTPLDREEPSCDKVVKYLVSDILVDVYEKEEEWQRILEIPTLALDKIRAKAFLQKQSPKEGTCLYDHLSELLNKILAEKPEHVIDYFEEYSRNLKEERFRPATDHLQDVYIPPEQHEMAKKRMSLFQVPPEKEAEEAPEEEDTPENPSSDVMELLFHFEQAGVGLPRNEMFLIALSIHKLQLSQSFKKIRFWGKILGTKNNYIVAETELPEEEYDQRNKEAEGKEGKADEEGEEGAEEDQQLVPKQEEQHESIAEEEEGQQEGGGGDAPLKTKPLPPVPKSMYKPPPEVPSEKSGEGVNKKVYFVCNEPWDEWVMLPDVTPQQINVARKIKRFFTGDLENEVCTYPTFPGNEMNYLRAQIARISAGTQVSPLGFYQFNEEEEEVEEEEEAHMDYVENPDFDPVPLKDLMDSSMSFWVHHTLPILKQGRTIWWNPKAKSEEEQLEEEEEEEEETPEVGEVGPPLLTPLSEDATLETIPPWSVRQSSQLLPDFGVASIRSNLWPGAFAYAISRKFDNVYIGWGHKYVTHNYTPPPLEPIQNEYPLGPEIMEMTDPTPEDEEAWRLANEKKKPTPEEGAEEEEEGDEEEGEEEEEEEEEDQ